MFSYQIVMLRTVRYRQEARVFGGKRRIDSAVEQTALVSGRLRASDHDWKELESHLARFIRLSGYRHLQGHHDGRQACVQDLVEPGDLERLGTDQQRRAAARYSKLSREVPQAGGERRY